MKSLGSRHGKIRLPLVLIFTVAVIGGLALWAVTTPDQEREIGSYVTSLRGRTLSTSQCRSGCAASQRQ